ncbi:MAG: hypothetical protein AAFY59_04415 [Pseudomonadota bacterium]
MAEPERAPLGVGALIGDTLALARRSWRPILLATYPPLVALYAISTLLFPLSGDGAVFSAAEIPMTAFDYLTALPVFALATLIADARFRGAPLVWGPYLARVALASGPLILMGAGFYLLVIAALLALIVPGFYAIGVFTLLVPVFLLEGHGWRSPARSFRLAAGYFWPLAGAVALILVISILAVLLMLLPFFLGLFGGYIAIDNVNSVLLSALSDAIYGVFLSCFGIVLHARLVWLKEGGEGDALADVFQ